MDKSSVDSAWLTNEIIKYLKNWSWSHGMKADLRDAVRNILNSNDGDRDEELDEQTANIARLNALKDFKAKLINKSTDNFKLRKDNTAFEYRTLSELMDDEIKILEKETDKYINNELKNL